MGPQQIRYFGIILGFAILHGSAFAALDKGTIAVIDGKKISTREFNRRYKDNIRYFKFTPPTRENVLNDIIKFELGVKEARRRGLDKDPEIKERMQTVLYQALVDKVLSKRFKKIEVKDSDVSMWCKKFPEVRTSHVYIPLRVDALESEKKEAFKKAGDALASLKNGTAFEKVVSQYSEGYATAAGGDIGFQMKDKLDPTYYAAATALPIGGTTKTTVRSQFGLHLIKLTGKKSCSEINVAEWKRMIYDEKRTRMFNNFLERLRRKASVQINHGLLKQ